MGNFQKPKRRRWKSRGAKMISNESVKNSDLQNLPTAELQKTTGNLALITGSKTNSLPLDSIDINGNLHMTLSCNPENLETANCITLSRDLSAECSHSEKCLAKENENGAGTNSLAGCEILLKSLEISAKAHSTVNSCLMQVNARDRDKFDTTDESEVSKFSLSDVTTFKGRQSQSNDMVPEKSSPPSSSVSASCSSSFCSLIQESNDYSISNGDQRKSFLLRNSSSNDNSNCCRKKFGQNNRKGHREEVSRNCLSTRAYGRKNRSGQKVRWHNRLSVPPVVGLPAALQHSCYQVTNTESCSQNQRWKESQYQDQVKKDFNNRFHERKVYSYVDHQHQNGNKCSINKLRSSRLCAQKHFVPNGRWNHNRSRSQKCNSCRETEDRDADSVNCRYKDKTSCQKSVNMKSHHHENRKLDQQKYDSLQASDTATSRCGERDASSNRRQSKDQSSQSLSLSLPAKEKPPSGIPWEADEKPLYSCVSVSAHGNHDSQLAADFLSHHRRDDNEKNQSSRQEADQILQMSQPPSNKELVGAENKMEENSLGHTLNISNKENDRFKQTIIASDENMNFSDPTNQHVINGNMLPVVELGCDQTDHKVIKNVPENTHQKDSKSIEISSRVNHDCYPSLNEIPSFQVVQLQQSFQDDGELEYSFNCLRTKIENILQNDKLCITSNNPDTQSGSWGGDNENVESHNNDIHNSNCAFAMEDLTFEHPAEENLPLCLNHHGDSSLHIFPVYDQASLENPANETELEMNASPQQLNPECTSYGLTFEDEIKEEMARAQNMLPMKLESKTVRVVEEALNPHADEFSPKLRDHHGKFFSMTNRKGTYYFTPEPTNVPLNPNAVTFPGSYIAEPEKVFPDSTPVVYIGSDGSEPDSKFPDSIPMVYVDFDAPKPAENVAMASADSDKQALTEGAAHATNIVLGSSDICCNVGTPACCHCKRQSPHYAESDTSLYIGTAGMLSRIQAHSITSTGNRKKLRLQTTVVGHIPETAQENVHVCLDLYTPYKQDNTTLMQNIIPSDSNQIGVVPIQAQFQFYSQTPYTCTQLLLSPSYPTPLLVPSPIKDFPSMHHPASSPIMSFPGKHCPTFSPVMSFPSTHHLASSPVMNLPGTHYPASLPVMNFPREHCPASSPMNAPSECHPVVAHSSGAPVTCIAKPHMPVSDVSSPYSIISAPNVETPGFAIDGRQRNTSLAISANCVNNNDTTSDDVRPEREFPASYLTDTPSFVEIPNIDHRIRHVLSTSTNTMNRGVTTLQNSVRFESEFYDATEYEECKRLVERLVNNEIPLDVIERIISSERQRQEMEQRLRIALDVVEESGNTSTVDEMTALILLYIRN